MLDGLRRRDEVVDDFRAGSEQRLRAANFVACWALVRLIGARVAAEMAAAQHATLAIVDAPEALIAAWQELRHCNAATAVSLVKGEIYGRT